MEDYKEVYRIKELRQKAEAEIQVVLNELQRQTGCNVANLDFQYEEPFVGPYKITRFKIDLRLP